MYSDMTRKEREKEKAFARKDRRAKWKGFAHLGERNVCISSTLYGYAAGNTTGTRSHASMHARASAGLYIRASRDFVHNLIILSLAEII